jgi:hypothetical protein
MKLLSVRPATQPAFAAGAPPYRATAFGLGDYELRGRGGHKLTLLFAATPLVPHGAAETHNR